MGFTLIELLVTFTLISIISSIGFASFASYGKKQVTAQAAEDLKQAINTARFSAISSVKPSDVSGSLCSKDDTLKSYTVKLCVNNKCDGIPETVDGGSYVVQVDCGSKHFIVSQKNLPNGVIFSAPPSDYGLCQNDLIFHSLSSYIENVPCGVTLTGSGDPLSVLIDINGYISLRYQK